MLDFLIREVCIPLEAIPKVLHRKPQLLGYSLAHKLRPTAAFFMQELGLAPQHLAAMVARCPALLGYSVADNLRPTIEFLRASGREYNATAEDWRRELIAAPQLLTYSLEKRIKPRVGECISLAAAAAAVPELAGVAGGKGPKSRLRKRPLSAAAVARALKMTRLACHSE